MKAHPTTGQLRLQQGPAAARPITVRPTGVAPKPAVRRRDPFRMALILAMIVTVSRIHQHFAPMAALRPALVLVLVALAYALANPRVLSQDLLRTWPAKAVAAMGIIACISVPFGISIGSSGKFMLESYGKVLVFAFLLIAAMRHYRDVSLVVWAYVLSCGVLVWMSMFVFGLVQGRLMHLYTYDANDLGVVLMVGLPLALLTFQTSKKRGRLLSGVILLGIGMALARSGSRGGFLGLIAVGIALFFLANRVAITKRLAFLGAVVLALSIAAPAGYWEQMKTVMRPTEDYNWDAESGRRKLAQRGVGYMLSRPFTGLGVNNFARAEGTISEMARDADWGRDRGIRWTTAHNSFVQIGAETGFPGLIVFSSIVFGGIFAMLRARRRLPKTWATGDEEERFLFYTAQYLPVSLVGFAVTAFFVSFAYLDTVYILAAVMAGFYVSLEAKRRRGGIPAAVRPGYVRRSAATFPGRRPPLPSR